MRTDNINAFNMLATAGRLKPYLITDDIKNIKLKDFRW